MADNMGGILSAWYCIATDIQSCVVLKNGIIVNLPGNRDWVNFDARIGNIEINVTENSENGLSFFNVEGKIRCPRSIFADVGSFHFNTNLPVLIKYFTTNGDVLVVGDKENPVRVNLKMLNPAQASGFSGAEYTLTGVMKHPELPLL
jgi:hypothetical protein